MCGVAGLFHLDERPVSVEHLKAMCARLRHRGPDAQDIWSEGAVGLAHTRLSILDLTESAAQPMVDKETGVALTYNGEVYNYVELRRELHALGHRFISSGDTEVVLRAYLEWGDGCFSKFNGMWGLAIWDPRVQVCVLARDRFGVKPLYYGIHDRTLGFASEVKALLVAFPHCARPNRQVMREFVETGGLDWTEESFFEGIVSLKPAHVARVNREGRVTSTRYWDFDPDRAHRQYDYSDPVETFRSLFVDAVRLRLRSDVDVGTCLSGGLDSSSIVSVARHVLGHERMHAFSSMHQEKEANEEKYIRAVASDTEVFLHPVLPNIDGLREDLNLLVWHHERPAPTASLYSQWEVMREASQHVKVLLDGQGADELLLGYTGYFTTYYRSVARAALGGDLRSLVHGALTYPVLRYTAAHPILRNMVKQRLPRVAQRVAHKVQSKLVPQPPSLVHSALAKNTSLQWPSPEPRTGDPMLDLLYHQFFHVGLPSLLHNEDRNGMAFSVEGRLPFTDDHRLVEFCMALPLQWRLRHGWTKYILRESMRGTLVEPVRRRRRKLGFPTPLGAWIRKDPEAQKLWQDLKVQRYELIAPGAVDSLLDEHICGAADRSDMLFRALTVQRWCEVFVDGGGETPTS